LVLKERALDGSGKLTEASIYRMVTDKHICPYGLQAKDLLERESFVVDDHWLTTREETDAFKREHEVESTPITCRSASCH
jgi:glutaredoxin